jgi:hypothetical protein
MILVHGGTCFHQLFKTVAYTQNPGFRVNECNGDFATVGSLAARCCLVWERLKLNIPSQSISRMNEKDLSRSHTFIPFVKSRR